MDPFIWIRDRKRKLFLLLLMMMTNDTKMNFNFSLLWQSISICFLQEEKWNISLKLMIIWIVINNDNNTLVLVIGLRFIFNQMNFFPFLIGDFFFLAYDACEWCVTNFFLSITFLIDFYSFNSMDHQVKQQELNGINTFFACKEFS